MLLNLIGVSQNDDMIVTITIILIYMMIVLIYLCTGVTSQVTTNVFQVILEEQEPLNIPVHGSYLTSHNKCVSGNFGGAGTT